MAHVRTLSRRASLKNMKIAYSHEWMSYMHKSKDGTLQIHLDRNIQRDSGPAKLGLIVPYSLGKKETHKGET